jgi:spore coat polysaccharide biosynthesis protein SpsF
MDGASFSLPYIPSSPMSNPYHHLLTKATVGEKKPFVVGLIQARMGSTRLPGKVLLPLPKDNGMPVLWHDFNRLSACKNVDKWVLATSTWHTDTVLEDFAKEHGILCFRGSESDCMERIFTGAIAHGAKSGDYILRITSDCPLIDANLVDRGVKEAIEGNYDQFGLYDQYPRSTQYADGLDFQVFSYDGMARMNEEATEPQDREHVGPYMMDHPEKFRVGHMDLPNEKAKNRNWTLDNPPDYEFLSEVYKYLWKGKDCTSPFTTDDLVELLERHPELSKINHIPFELQNEGLLKSYRKKLLSQNIDIDTVFVKNFDVSKRLLKNANITFNKSLFLPVMASKHHCYAYDVDGNEFIDLSLCNGMVSFGHVYGFEEGIKSGGHSLEITYKHYGFSNEIGTVLKEREYTNKMLKLLSPCKDLNQIAYTSSIFNAFSYVFSSLGRSDTRSMVLVDKNSTWHDIVTTLNIKGLTFKIFNSQVDGDLRKEIAKNGNIVHSILYTLLDNNPEAVENCRKASELASLPGSSIPFIVDEILTSGRVAFPSIASENHIRCDLHLLGPALANGCKFYPIAYNKDFQDTLDLNIVKRFTLASNDTSVALTFQVAILAFEYYENRCVINNLHRFTSSMFSGINSALMTHKMQDQVKVVRYAGRIKFEYNSNSIDERNRFNKVMHDELLGRGIYLEDNVVTSSFSVCNSILVRFGLSFEAALGKFKSEM